jgi:hypothetical protein
VRRLWQQEDYDYDDEDTRPMPWQQGYPYVVREQRAAQERQSVASPRPSTLSPRGHAFQRSPRSQSTGTLCPCTPSHSPKARNLEPSELWYHQKHPSPPSTSFWRSGSLQGHYR